MLALSKDKQEPQDVARHKPYLSSFVQYACTSINGHNGNSLDNPNKATASMKPRKRIITIYSKYNQVCKNLPCELKLHRLIFLLISSIQNVVSHFHKLQKKAH